MSDPRVTYVGGPTALIEWHGLRFLTDPTFDPTGTRYELPGYTMRKTAGPAVTPDAVGLLEAVLLSHDHHVDNFDHAGRQLAADAPRILTTEAGAGRLGPQAVGLAVWESPDFTAPDWAPRGSRRPAGGRSRVRRTTRWRSPVCRRARPSSPCISRVGSTSRRAARPWSARLRRRRWAIGCAGRRRAGQRGSMEPTRLQTGIGERPLDRVAVLVAGPVARADNEVRGAMRR